MVEPHSSKYPTIPCLILILFPCFQTRKPYESTWGIVRSFPDSVILAVCAMYWVGHWHGGKVCLCDSRDVLCGQLHCAGGDFMNNVGVRSTISVITATTRSGEPCRWVDYNKRKKRGWRVTENVVTSSVYLIMSFDYVVWLYHSVCRSCDLALEKTWIICASVVLGHKLTLYPVGHSLHGGSGGTFGVKTHSYRWPS